MPQSAPERRDTVSPRAVSLRSSVVAVVLVVGSAVTATWWVAGPAETWWLTVMYPAVGFAGALLLRLQQHDRSVAMATVVAALVAGILAPVVCYNPLFALALGTVIIGLSEEDRFLLAGAIMAAVGGVLTTWPSTFLIVGSGPKWITAAPVLVGAVLLLLHVALTVHGSRSDASNDETIWHLPDSPGPHV